MTTVGRVGALRRDVLRKVRQVGVLQMLRHGALKLIRGLHRENLLGHLLDADSFDLKYGTDTAGTVNVGALDIPDAQLAHANRYQTLPPEDFLEALRQLPVLDGEFIFVDIGSGKGRTLLLASFFPFIEIVGIELSPKLVAVAARNIELFKDGLQRCHAIRTVCEQATQYQLPHQDLVLYLYNPFGEQRMRAFVSTVESSLRSFRRRIYVVYHQPEHRNVWDASEMFRLADTSGTYLIYESDPSYAC
jgi:hypothetical protein